MADTPPIDAGAVNRTIDAVWRMESAKLIASVARLVRDVGLAEDLAQDALVAAMERWPESGIPDKPAAWLMATARHKAIDHIRRDRRAGEKYELLGHELESSHPDPERELVAAMDDHIGDDMLRLVFTACHPVLSTDARVALTLRMLGGLTTEEIARAYLAPVATVAQRIVRAKRTLAVAHVQFELPPREELAERMEAVLEVIYLIFNEGYAATEGDHWTRPELCRDAMRLGRILTGLAPDDPEVHGLVALMEIQASRLRARVGPGGEPILLMDQDRSRWDRLLIARGLGSLNRSMTIARSLGPYALQAAIAACHARASRPEDTDWVRIAALYDALSQLTRSPVVELNRAVAVSMAFGPEEGLQIVDAISTGKSLRNYHPLYAVRGDLLHRLNRREEATADFRRAASLTHNSRERDYLLGRANGSGSDGNGWSSDPPPPNWHPEPQEP